MRDAFTITVNFSFYNPTADIHIVGMFESNVPAVRNQINVRVLCISILFSLTVFALKTFVFSCFYCKFVIHSLVIRWSGDLVIRSSLCGLLDPPKAPFF